MHSAPITAASVRISDRFPKSGGSKVNFGQNSFTGVLSAGGTLSLFEAESAYFMRIPLYERRKSA